MSVDKVFAKIFDITVCVVSFNLICNIAIFGKGTLDNSTLKPPPPRCFFWLFKLQIKVSKGAKIRNRYNQVPHLTQDTNGKVTDSQLDTINESQEVSSFSAGDHNAHTRGIWKGFSMVFYLSNRFTKPIMFGIILKNHLSSMLWHKFHEDIIMQTRNILL